jgi:hypothetical protein
VYEERYGRGLTGGKEFAAPNPPYGVTLWYSLRQRSAPVRVVISDPVGRVMADLKGSRAAGLHKVQWNLRGAAGLDLFQGARPVPAGDYVARLFVGERLVMARKVRVE